MVLRWSTTEAVRWEAMQTPKEGGGTVGILGLAVMGLPGLFKTTQGKLKSGGNEGRILGDFIVTAQSYGKKDSHIQGHL